MKNILKAKSCQGQNWQNWQNGPAKLDDLIDLIK